MESHQNDAGRSIGTTSKGWQTTKGLENRTFVKMFNAPMMLVAGNRQDDAFPASSLGGGRIQSIASSVLDHAGSFLVCNSRSKGGHMAFSDESTGDSNSVGKKRKLEMMTGRLQQQNRRIQELKSATAALEIKDTNPVKPITEHIGEKLRRTSEFSFCGTCRGREFRFYTAQ